jgi:hypothetical protein
MTGLTTEIYCVSDALQRLRAVCLETYGKSPTHFIVGIEEAFRLRDELDAMLSRGEKRFPKWLFGIPVVVASAKSALDIGIPIFKAA